MIQCRCILPNCFFVVNYHSPINMEQVKRSPPFHNMELLDGEHEHVWKIKEIKFGREK